MIQHDILEEIASGQPGFSFEVLPPLKGKSIATLFDNVGRLMPYRPRYVNITTHRSELVYKSVQGGLYERVSERSRPGTVAVAAAIQNRFNIPAVPHIICSGYSARETEYALIDLSFLGINNLLLLRGDKAKHEPRFIPDPAGYSHASELQQQVNTFNDGVMLDGTAFELEEGFKFSYGVAGYPEKHEESPNTDTDLRWLKHKVDQGASYIVTQLFFDNDKFYRFVAACRDAGITVPIIPGIKPIVNLNQLTVLPKTFKVDIPDGLVKMLSHCTDNVQAKDAGVEWAIRQSRDLIDHGYTHIHYYSHNAAASVVKIVESVFGTSANG